MRRSVCRLPILFGTPCPIPGHSVLAAYCCAKRRPVLREARRADRSDKGPAAISAWPGPSGTADGRLAGRAKNVKERAILKVYLPMFVRKASHLCALLSLLGVTAGAETLTLNQGDHICLIGNALADRMQHDGWLETLICARFPKHDLVFRNLAFPGDEVALRHRSENFGSPDDWLAKTRADVIFAFFGFNETFNGQAGLEKFKPKL